MKNLIPYFIQHQFEQQKSHGFFTAYTMFIDLSGFTPMTATFIERGNEGAEELSIILNKVFEPMVSLVYRKNGFIPYFAGDAFTAIFPKNEVRHPWEIILTAQELRNLFDIKIFVHADSDERLIRRLQRDTKERGHDLDKVLTRYQTAVKPMHLQFIEPSKEFADIIIPTNRYNTVAVYVVRTIINNNLT